MKSINQLPAAITYANACLRWLDRDKPNLDEARSAVINIVRDGQRAAQIIARIRTQFEKGALNQEVFGVSEIIRETVGLLRGEAGRYDISVRTELAADLPRIVGDRVQLQQVAMNLIVNSFEAMKDVDGIREMVIRSQRAENGQILVSVSDTGMGFRRSSQNRFSIRSLQLNPTAPAWGFASAVQSSSRMAGVYGSPAPLGRARSFSSPCLLRLPTVIN